MNKKEKNYKKNQKDPVTRALLKLAIKIVSICLVIAFVFTFIFGIYRVNDTSMVPNISPGDMILFYRLDKDFVVGETVVYSYNKENKIGRIVAMPGDVVNIDEKGLVVNNSHQYEPKIYKETLPFTDGIKYPVKLKENEIFLLADNRDKSVDSRLFGPVEKKFIKGKIFTLLRKRGI
ncbi:signal peptidase I [Anaerococcus jeddahensis]|uniref:signal peptidase I n=1 Tax=Anaerococcus jeddahensis TaxID=1673719 RepID=UPI0006724DDF|nr:signal peptidase I [Anaerococcus jeddahensis]